MRINTNLIALNTKNQLKKNNKTTSNIMEKLSSGKRINKAADDAAGLAISQKMRAQIRGLDQANENVQDGVSLIQTAEGALNEMEAMTQRMRELSVQGANDTLTTEDREKIQKELDALKSQVDVIANTTEFNTRKLLNGDLEKSDLKTVTKTVIKEVPKIVTKTITEVETITEENIITQNKTVIQNLDLNIPESGSIASQNIIIEGENIDFSFQNDLSNNLDIKSNYQGSIIGESSFNKVDIILEPTIKWSKSFGGSNLELEKSNIQKTADGGYIIGGTSISNDGDINGDNHGDSDYWILKLDINGDREWAKSYGGTAEDYVSSIQQTSDGGYIISGTTFSDDGDINEAHNGEDDYWILKIDSVGNKEWSKILGGTETDRAKSIQETNDGGFIVAGDSRSNTKDINISGAQDIWLVKLNNDGDKVWDKSIGGSHSDLVKSIEKTSDNGYIIVGSSNSNDGDINGDNHGGTDTWIVKLYNNGDINWTKSLGGSGVDNGQSIQQTSDGGYIIASSSQSNDGDISGDNHDGSSDYWITKLKSDGSKDWAKSFGGSGIDIPQNIKQTSDGGYITVGYTKSIDGDLSNYNNENDSYIDYDYWVVKLDSTGDKQWIKVLGGNAKDLGDSIQEIDDGEYIVSGISASNDGDINGDNHGGYDYWIANLSAPNNSAVIKNIDLDLDNIKFYNKEITFNNVSVTFQNSELNKLDEISLDISVDETAITTTEKIITKEVEETIMEKVEEVITYNIPESEGLSLQIGSNTGQQMKFSINDMRSEALGMTNGYPKVIPRENAVISIEISDKAIRKLSNERARLGAKQNRLEHISKNLANTSENLQNAESRIADADMAKQAMKLAKNDILIQASQSMLAQANNLPQGVLQLLK